MSDRPRVAFVVQRCGDDIAGGAETLARASAQSMRDLWECEILTTCARDSSTWANDYPVGQTTIAGIAARRFPVDAPRDPREFDRASRRMGSESGTIADQEAWMRLQGPYAPGLFEYLATEGSSYDCVFFFSYLYATTYFGLPLVAERAVLVPLAHDEWMLHLPLFARSFACARSICFVSEEERALVDTRFPEANVAGSIIRIAVTAPTSLDAAGFRTRFGPSERFGLYVGRVDTAKGVGDLLERYRRSRALGLKRGLVLVGPVTLDIEATPGLRVLGALPEPEKWNAYAAADFAIVPSVFESLSIAALEAWSTKTAVLANGGSAVLIGQCRRAGGGLWYSNDDEFFELYDTALLGRAEPLGRNGAAYVAQTFTEKSARASLQDAFEMVRQRA